jgi:hypothetical protein
LPTSSEDPSLRKLFEIAERLLEAHNAQEALFGRQLPADFRNAAARLICFRGAEFAMSAADDFYYGRPSAGAVMGRSLLESAMELRWALISDDNARRWWKEGDTAIWKSLRSLGQSTDPAIVALREGRHVAIGLPGFPTMAKEAGFGDPYSRWYSTLSAYSHGSRMSFGHAYGPPGEPRVPPVVPTCIYFAADIEATFRSWTTSRVVPPPCPLP